jgi:hypothetical protein
MKSQKPAHTAKKDIEENVNPATEKRKLNLY